MTTFPAILLMFLFKKSRRTFLRPNRINTALKQEGKSLELVNLSEEQRWTRLQILQTAIQFCMKNMPNFHKRRFRYFEGFFPHKLTNIAGFDWVNKRRFWGHIYIKLLFFFP